MRQDISVYNEASLFTIHSGGLGGRTRAELEEDLPQAFRDGLVIPIGLAQDDCLTFRILLDENLTPEEEDEWVGKIVWKLRIPDGKLVVEGGFDPDTEDDSEYTASVDVPAGDYRVEVYTLFHGVNGEYCCPEDEVGEPVGAWFRRTWPGQPIPELVRHLLVDNPHLDPGHEDEWKAIDREGIDRHRVDFIVRLTPLAGELPELELEPYGWIEIGTGRRIPERCPRGLAPTLPAAD